MFTTVWEFLVAPGREAEFRRIYGAGGAWVELFTGAPGYRETLLLQDTARPDRFVTLDRWDSPADYQRFRAARAEAYAELDRRTAGLTRSERRLGTVEE